MRMSTPSAMVPVPLANNSAQDNPATTPPSERAPPCDNKVEDPPSTFSCSSMLYHIQIIDSLNLVQQIQQSREASPCSLR
jgi:heme-binding NEAT domain protein